jgi:hypothetical protein
MEEPYALGDTQILGSVIASEHNSAALVRSRVRAAARAYFSSHGVNSSSISPSEGGCSIS